MKKSSFSYFKTIIFRENCGLRSKISHNRSVSQSLSLSLGQRTLFFILGYFWNFIIRLFSFLGCFGNLIIHFFSFWDDLEIWLYIFFHFGMFWKFDYTLVFIFGMFWKFDYTFFSILGCFGNLIIRRQKGWEIDLPLWELISLCTKRVWGGAPTYNIQKNQKLLP